MSEYADAATPENLNAWADRADQEGFPNYGWKLAGAAERIESLTSENTRLRALLEEIPWEAIDRLVSAFEGIEPASEDGMVYVARRLLAIKEKIE